MQENKNIILASEKGSNLPVVVGSCPSCGLGTRSLVLVDYRHNKYFPDQGLINFQCIGCSNYIIKRVFEVSGEGDYGS